MLFLAESPRQVRYCRQVIMLVLVAVLIGGQEMWDQEKKHLYVMNKLQVQHRVRPTLLNNVVQVAGFGLGAITALMGPEAAMACTEAVETVIGEHYNE